MTIMAASSKHHRGRDVSFLLWWTALVSARNFSTCVICRLSSAQDYTMTASFSLKQRLPLYAEVMRLNRPIGIYLLLWPTLWPVDFLDRLKHQR